jgi:hypothetical protein
MHAGILQSEEIFYAKADGTKKPDGNVTDSTFAIGPDECGFGYILDVAAGLSTSGNPSRVIVVTPLAAGSATTFDAGPFGGFAIVLKIDQSASALRIATSGTATTGPAMTGGLDLLAGGGFWGAVVPTVMSPAVE